MGRLLKILTTFFFIFFHITAYSGDPYRLPAGAAEAGKGYTIIAGNSFWSGFHNQAALAYYKSISAGFNYENRFGIKELGTRSAGLIIPSGRTSTGIIYSYFGNPDFKRHSAGIACGLRLSESIAAGVQVDYFSERTFGEYENIESVTFEAGIIAAAGENTKIGIHVFNPLPSSMNKYSIPARITLGAGTALGSSITAGAEVDLSTGGKIVFRTGMEYEAFKRFIVRGGFISENNSFTMGLGYSLGFVQVDLGFVTHDKLGVTSLASLIFNMKNKN